MKKNIIIKITASLFIISSLILTGCQEPIYEAIRQDVKPEEPTVSGYISNITRYTVGDKEFLALAADEGLRYKKRNANSHGEWRNYSVPFSLHKYDFFAEEHTGEQILTVLANSTTLYMITAEYSQTSAEGKTKPSTIRLYGKNIALSGSHWSSSGSWKMITRDSSLFPIEYDYDDDTFYTNFRVFQTNAPMKDHREAFIRVKKDSNYHYYQLKGLDKPVEITINPDDIIDPHRPSTPKADYTPKASSAVWFKGGIKFIASSVATTNETYTKDATYFYYTNDDDDLYFSDGTNTDNKDTEYSISALATCADVILIGYGDISSGRAHGIGKYNLANGVPTTKASFSTNAQFQITQNYLVLCLLNGTPEKKESESGLYAAVGFSGVSYNFDNVGLWSYYPDRGNWNRE